MGLFQTQYGGQGVVTPYQFAPSVGLPDYTALIPDRSAQAQAAGTKGTQKDQTEIEALPGATREYHRIMADINAQEESVLAEYRDIWENKYSGGSNTQAFLADHGHEIMMELQHIQSMRKDLDSNLALMKSDLDALNQARKNRDFMDNIVLRIGAGGIVEGFGLRLGGEEGASVGWGILGTEMGVTEDTIIEPYKGHQALHHIAQNASAFGTDIDFGYDATEARKTYRQMALDVNKMFSDFVTNNNLAIKDNLQQLTGFLQKTVQDVPQHLKRALYNEAATAAQWITDENGNLDLVMPVYSFGVREPGLSVRNMEDIKKAGPFLQETGEYISLLQDVNGAIQNMAVKIGGATALGMQNIRIRPYEDMGIGTPRDSEVERGFFVEFGQERHPIFGNEALVFSGGSFTENIGKQLADFGLTATRSQIQSEIDRAAARFFSANTLEENFFDSEGNNLRGRTYAEVGAYIENLGKTLHMQAGNPASDDIQDWFSYLPSEAQHLYGRLEKERFEASMRDTENAYTKNDFRIFAESDKAPWYRKILQTFGVRPAQSEVDVSLLRPGDIHANATLIPNWVVRVHPATAEHVADHQRIIGGSIGPAAHGNIRIAGTDIKNIGDITNRSVPFIQSNEFYSPMYFESRDGASQDYRFSTKGYVVLSKDDLKKVKVNRINEKPLAITDAFDGYVQEIGKREKVFEELKRMGLTTDNEKLLESAFSHYSIARDEETYYLVPVLHVIDNDRIFDEEYQWMRKQDVAPEERMTRRAQGASRWNMWHDSARLNAFQPIEEE